MAQNVIFDFLAADLFAAAIDDVLQPSLDIQIAVDPPHHVAHAVVAVAGERGAVFLRSVIVAANGIGAAADQLANLAIGHVVAVLVDNADFIGLGETAARPVRSVLKNSGTVTKDRLGKRMERS